MLGPEGLIARTVAAQAEELREIRRHLHRHPELSQQEHATTDYIVEQLSALGLSPVRMPRTGALCDIPGSNPTLRPIALRADMDALGIPELSTVPFRSTVAGVSHSCGHDVHMSAVLGAAHSLVRVAEAGALHRSVRLVFQPSEEMHPCGALEMIAEGVVEGVDSILALHCDPGVDVGHIGLKTGPITSATDPVAIQVRGSGGHTSRPHLSQDLIYALGSIVTQLPAALTRRMDPRSGVNLTWGSIHAGSAFNAIPSSGTLEGTLRCRTMRPGTAPSSCWSSSSPIWSGPGAWRPGSPMTEGCRPCRTRPPPSLCWRRRWPECWAGRTSTPPRSPWAERTSRGTSRRCPGRSRAWARAPRVGAPTTCTWVT